MPGPASKTSRVSIDAVMFFLTIHPINDLFTDLTFIGKMSGSMCSKSWRKSKLHTLFKKG